MNENGLFFQFDAHSVGSYYNNYHDKCLWWLLYRSILLDDVIAMTCKHSIVFIVSYSLIRFLHIFTLTITSTFFYPYITYFSHICVLVNSNSFVFFLTFFFFFCYEGPYGKISNHMVLLWIRITRGICFAKLLKAWHIYMVKGSSIVTWHLVIYSLMFVMILKLVTLGLVCLLIYDSYV